MADVFTKEKRSWVMSRIRGKETKMEKLLENKMKRVGINFESYPKIYGKPDFLIKDRIVVFVDGCFWHKCPKHYRTPKSRRKFWMQKIKTNVKRDKQVSRQLKEDYKVLRFWEHDIEKRPDYIIDKIKKISDTI